jgi:hypothetical protein
MPDLLYGQRSLFHISMTAAALDVESGITEVDEAWDTDKLMRPVLTVVAVEEPENNRALSRPAPAGNPQARSRHVGRRCRDHAAPTG